MNELQQQVTEMLDALKNQRNLLAEARERRRKIIEAAQATDEYKLADLDTNEAETIVTGIEALLRTQGLMLYNADCELPDGLTARNFTVVKIVDPLKAKEWSIVHFTPALKLDEKVFEKAAKDGHIPADLATVEKEKRIQIATQL